MRNLETKKAIRKQILSNRNLLTEAERRNYDFQIREKLYAMQEYQNATQVLLYLSYGTEAGTWEILEHCIQEGKEVYCPKVLSDGIMEFFRVCSKEDIAKGYQGIMEPVTENKFLYQEHSTHLVLMIMPLTVFDKNRNRIGYGKGFYDRYLCGKTDIKTIAIAYDEQEYMGSIPTGNYDIKPNVILTQTQIFS